MKTDPVRYAVVFATAGSHDPSFKRSTQASTWLIGLASPNRPDLVPTVTMGSACSAKGFDRLPCAHRRENPLYINCAREKRVLTHNAMLPNLTCMPIAVVGPRTKTNRDEAIANELINDIWKLSDGVDGGYTGNVIQIWMAKPGTPSNLPQCTISSLMTLQMTAFQQWSVEFSIDITSADGNISGKNMMMSIDLRSLVVEVDNFLKHGRSNKTEIVWFLKYMDKGKWFTELYDKKQKRLQDGTLNEEDYSMLKRSEISMLCLLIIEQYKIFESSVTTHVVFQPGGPGFQYAKQDFFEMIEE